MRISDWSSDVCSSDLGVVIMRYGGDALKTIEAVRAKLEQLRAGLPAGVEIVPVYDRGALIERAVDNLKDKLLEEFIVVSLISMAFLLHARSALVAILTLPIGEIGRASCRERVCQYV